MMKITTISGILLICLGLSSVLFAQQSREGAAFKYDTHFRLNSNSSFYAELIDMRGDTIEVELSSGNRVKLLSSQIRKMEAADPSSQKAVVGLAERNHLFREKLSPHFFQLSSGLIFGGSSDVILSGANMSFAYKYQWRPQHFLVGQMGVDIMDGLFPVLSESVTVGYEWVKFTDRVNPFLSAQMGWGIAQYLDEEPDNPWWTPPERSIESGYRASLGTGVMFTGKRHSVFRLGVEFVVQQLTYREEFPDVQTSVFDYEHRRIQFNIGYIF